MLVMQAKRDPYRFRFPIEMRFVDPNIDHMMYVHLCLFLKRSCLYVMELMEWTIVYLA